MPGWLKALAAWWRLPTLGAFAELDLQIAKLRALRDSYQAAHNELRPDTVPNEMPGQRATC